MKKILCLVLLNCISAIIFSQNLPRVIVLGFDGMGGYAFPKTNTPNIKKITEEGCYTYQAKSVFPSVSSPNWSSMINGTSPSKHKIWSNAWKYKKTTKKSFCGNEKGQLFPTIFRLLREQMPNINMACIHQWDNFIKLTEKDVFTKVIQSKDEDITAQEAVKLIEGNTPDFLFLDFDHVDHIGHAIGHHTPAYYKAVEKADSLTGVIVQALQQKGIYDETYIIITSDHGGRLKSHGGLTASEMNIPWIIRGPNIKKGFHIQTLVKQYDTAATIAKILGIKIPDCWIGKPVDNIFIQ